MNDTGVFHCNQRQALSSIPYTPEESLSAMRYFLKNKDKCWAIAGLRLLLAHNSIFLGGRCVLAIDQGPQI